jgi:hypothetical protein
MVVFVCANIHIMLSHHIQLNHIFCKNYVLVRILLRDIFISMLVKELHALVHSCEHPYHVATSYSSLSEGYVVP